MAISFCVFVFLIHVVASVPSFSILNDDTYEMLLDAIVRGINVPFSRTNPVQRRVHNLKSKISKISKNLKKISKISKISKKS